jgi:hypothetical protein
MMEAYSMNFSFYVGFPRRISSLTAMVAAYIAFSASKHLNQKLLP